MSRQDQGRVRRRSTLRRRPVSRAAIARPLCARCAESSRLDGSRSSTHGLYALWEVGPRLGTRRVASPGVRAERGHGGEQDDPRPSGADMLYRGDKDDCHDGEEEQSHEIRRYSSELTAWTRRNRTRLAVSRSRSRLRRCLALTVVLTFEVRDVGECTPVRRPIPEHGWAPLLDAHNLKQPTSKQAAQQKPVNRSSSNGNQPWAGSQRREHVRRGVQRAGRCTRPCRRAWVHADVCGPCASEGVGCSARTIR